MTLKTSRKTAASMRSNIEYLRSSLREDFQTIYGGIMVARGRLAVMLDNERRLMSKSLTRKLMDLNHEIDRLLTTSEDILVDLVGTRD